MTDAASAANTGTQTSSATTPVPAQSKVSLSLPKQTPSPSPLGDIGPLALSLPSQHMPLFVNDCWSIPSVRTRLDTMCQQHEVMAAVAITSSRLAFLPSKHVLVAVAVMDLLSAHTCPPHCCPHVPFPHRPCTHHLLHYANRSCHPPLPRHPPPPNDHTNSILGPSRAPWPQAQ